MVPSLEMNVSQQTVPERAKTARVPFGRFFARF
jgi:hypothetical protein